MIPLAEYAMKLTGAVSFVRLSVSLSAQRAYVVSRNAFRKQQILSFIDPSEKHCFLLKPTLVDFDMNFIAITYIIYLYILYIILSDIIK